MKFLFAIVSSSVLFAVASAKRQGLRSDSRDLQSEATSRVGGGHATNVEVSKVPATKAVQYSVRFDNNWSGRNHPVDYPSNAHWSPPVVACHSSDYQMWGAGAMATNGVTTVAETGGTGPITTELEAAGDAVLSTAQGVPTFNSATQTQTLSDTVSVDPTHTLCSTISMIAPSPDWFTGVYDVNFVQDGMWLREITISTTPWDGGSDSGMTYGAANDPTNPKVGIFELDLMTAPATGVLKNSAGDGVLPVGSWTFTLQAEPDPTEEPEAMRMGGGIVTSSMVSDIDSTESVKYTVKFVNNWSGVNHPIDYPSDAHWSPPIVAAHSSAYTMWAPDTMASEGAVIVAETGDPMTLISELTAAEDTILSRSRGEVTFNRQQQMQTLADPIMVDASHPYVSSMTMVAPSPDWFTGVYNLNMVKDGKWLKEITIESAPWDAGSDGGMTYNAADDPLDPHATIFELTATTAPSNGALKNIAGDDVLPVGSWTFTIQNEPATKTIEGGVVSDMVASEIPASVEAQYEVAFTNNWSGVNHPIDYPANAHWSPPVVAAHSSAYDMWSPGSSASEGVVIVAETGAPGTLMAELGAAGDAVKSSIQGVVTFNREVQSQTISETVSVDPDHPYLSGITMIAPSPDWFAGFSDMSPIDGDGNWLESFTIMSYPYDAGSDSGDTYNAADSPTDPRQTIFRLTTETVPDTGVLLNIIGDDVLPVASWTFTLKDKPEVVVIEIPQGVMCFSAESTVEVLDENGTTRLAKMSEVQVGHRVLADNNKYERIYAFGHRDENRRAEFLQLLPSKLELSRDHMVFVQGKGAIPASHVVIGDELNDGQVVEEIRKVVRSSVYAPYTPSGTIVVNGVLASNYIALQDSPVVMIGSVKTFSYQWMAHAFQLPHRIWCHYMGMESRILESGMSSWSEPSFKVAKWFLQEKSMNTFVAGAVLVPFVFVLAIFSGVEQIFLNPAILVIVVVFAKFLISLQRRTEMKTLN